MEKLGKMKSGRSDEIEKSFVGIGFECLDREMFDPEKCYGLLGRSGIKYARCQTGWFRCEKEPGVYDFSWLDRVVDSLRAVGVIPWFNVGFGNPLYMENVSSPYAVGCAPILYGAQAMEAWNRYLEALAAHFAGRVSWFEIWNEPDLSSFWYPSDFGQPKEYAALVAASGTAIRKVLPDAKIGATVSRFNFEYFAQVLSCLSPSDADFFSYHAYALSPEANYIENIRHFRKLIRKYGFRHAWVVQGESGFPSWFPDAHWLRPRAEGSERQQAAWQLRRYFLDAAAGVAVSSYFQMADMWERPYTMARSVQKKPAAQGILNGLVYTPKLSYFTLGRLSSFFSGTVHACKIDMMSGYPDESAHSYAKECLSYRINGNPFIAYWIPEKIEAELPAKEGFWINVESTALTRRIRKPVILDMLTGTVYEAELRRQTPEFLYFENLPYADYPMVLCDRSAIEITAEETEG